MGIKLVVEVLDHYRGPDHKFRWLIAFAEKASDKTRTGWPGRELMAQRTQRTPTRVSHLATELIEDGILQREGGGGRHRGTARYTLLPLPAQGASTAHPEKSSQGAPSAHPKPELKGAPGEPQGAPSAHPETDPHCLAFNPHTTLTPPGGDADATPTAQTVIGAFIDWDRANGGKLTRRTIGQLAKHVNDLLAEGIDDRYIRTGLAEWRAKEQHPATLDSFVSAAMNGHAVRRRPSTGDRALMEGAELKARIRKRKEPT